MKHQCNQSKPATTVLTSLDEGFGQSSHLWTRSISQQPPSALDDTVVAKQDDFRLKLIDPAPQPRCKRIHIQYRIGVPMEKHKDVPTQERPDMAFNELDYRRSQHPLKIVHARHHLRPSVIVRSSGTPTA